MIKQGWTWKGRRVHERISSYEIRTVNLAQMDVRLPAFQRGYVWKPTQVLALLDSMLWGLPIGQLILWEDQADPDGGVESSRFYWVIDGQQRISSLRGALIPGGPGGDVPRIYFNPDRDRFVVVKDGSEVSPRWPSLPTLCGSAEVFRWISTSPFADPATWESDPAVQRIFDIIRGIDSHTVSAMFLPRGFPESEIFGIFDRHNAGGTLMSRAQVRRLRGKG